MCFGWAPLMFLVEANGNRGTRGISIAGLSQTFLAALRGDFVKQFDDEETVM